MDPTQSLTLFLSLGATSEVARKLSFQLEDDSCDAVDSSPSLPSLSGFKEGVVAVASSSSASGIGSSVAGGNFVFFRPLENISYLTLLGDAPRRCDFICQCFQIIECDASNVVIGPQTGQPKLTKLSHLSYETLSSKLAIWEFQEADYHVTREMWLGSPLRTSFGPAIGCLWLNTEHGQWNYHSLLFLSFNGVCVV